MPSVQLIAPYRRTTPTPFTKRSRPLPPDLLRDASRRLGITALLMAGLWTAVAGLRHLVFSVHGEAVLDVPRVSVLDWVSAGAVAVSLTLYLYTRKKNRSSRFALDLGLYYLVFTAVAAATMINWEPVPSHTSVLPMVTAIGPLMLMFAAIVPSTPTKTLVAGLIAASMNPISMLVARARGTWNFEAPIDALIMHVPDYLLVVVAVVIAHVVTRLGEQVARARELGSYQLGDLIGRGGMGEVYRACHRMLTRPAAIKLIRPEMISPDKTGGGPAVRRFHREAKAIASLQSPHTVSLYDFGETYDGTFYLVMELLDGMTLETLVRTKGPLPAHRVVDIMRQVCDSLAEAHAAGLVHRDIKPANIHLGRVGVRHDFVKVLDFGLVTSMVGAEGAETGETATGLVIGTPAYMAPEMALGQPVDGRADIYALGCVAYYLLTGDMVFAASEGFHAIVKRLHEDPPPLSDRSELPVPAELERLVMACLARNPEDRPSAGQLASALTAVTIDRWTQADAARWWELNHREKMRGCARAARS